MTDQRTGSRTTNKHFFPGAALEKDGIQFVCRSETGIPPVLLLYRRGCQKPEREIPFQEPPEPGCVFSVKVKVSPSVYEYNYKIGSQIFTDPYARKIAGKRNFGEIPESVHSVRGSFSTRIYDWEGDERPRISYQDAVMYQLHVRGFTKQKNSGVRHKGTFLGLQEKLPYLKELGVNQLRLMPAYEFNELIPKMPAGVAGETEYRLNYWGYGAGFYFSPKAAYSSSAYPEEEFKNLVKTCHRQKMELLMEFSFPDEIRIDTMIQCLEYWAREYHVDGFCVMTRQPVLEELAKLPLFQDLKLIGSWLPEQIKSRGAGNREKTLAEANDGFMNDCRRILKGDGQCLKEFSFRLKHNPAGCQEINYMTSHDGFTLADLVSYDQKYNLENGEQNRDGTDSNFSWNCGAEGPTKKKDVLSLRMRQRKNAYGIMLFSQGTPMLLAGDEFGNSQNGNNNPYCHDSTLTWTDWGKARQNRELTEFVKKAIAFRRQHPVLHQKAEPSCIDTMSCGYPDLSFHGERAWYGDYDYGNRHIGCLYCGRYAGEEGFLYIAYNFHWLEQSFALPLLPPDMEWRIVMDTNLPESFPETPIHVGREKSIEVSPRSIMILEGKKMEHETSGNDEKDHLGEDQGTLQNHHGTQDSGDETLLQNRPVPSGTDA